MPDAVPENTQPPTSVAKAHYSEECLEAYECLEGGIDDPIEATFEITPVVLDSKEPVTSMGGFFPM